MRILTLHCDYIRFKALKKALKDADELSPKEKEEHEIKECLVVLTSIEQGDSSKEVKQLVEAVEKTAKEVKTDKVVLYPYAHLSSNLAKPQVALSLLKEAESELSKKFKTTRAPFGYYKEFEFKCKGHPLAELSKEFKSDSTQEVKTKIVSKEEPIDHKKLLTQISRSKLDTSKLKDNDHRILGQKLGLFMFNETSPGMPYWLPKGLIIYNELVEYWRRVHDKLSYQEIASPLINKKELYLISGHWEHYKENMFIAPTDENETYCLKPMNCPNAMIVFKSEQRSYKDLPLRLSDTDRLHRYELSGTLNGLLRCRSFQQDDSHNFITEEMIKEEYEHIFKICEKFYKIFNLEYSFRLGTRPEGFLGDKKVWDRAEKKLKEILQKSGKKFKIQEGDGAFYGPKVDILMNDSLGREWQMGTIQLDFQLPLRFGLTYTDDKGEEKAPVVVHRVIYGSLERFMGILLEHTNGALPLWLSPRQVRVISFTDRNDRATEKFAEELKELFPQLRVDTDTRSDTLQSKIRDAEMLKVNYMVIIGDKEEENNTLAIRPRGGKPQFGVKKEAFIEQIKKELEERK